MHDPLAKALAPPSADRIPVAAFPLAPRLFDVEGNLRLAEAGVRRAARAGARLLVLPELFAHGYAFDRRFFRFAERRCGAVATWMRRASRQFGICLAGTFPERDGGAVYNTLLLATPAGDAFFYRKRRLPLFERLYFQPGTDPGLFDTPLGRVGVLICWDMTSDRLVAEFQDKVDLLLISSAWPDTRGGSIPLPWLGKNLASIPLTRPAEISARLNVPLIACNMAGRFRTRVPFTLVRYTSEFVPATLIINPGEAIENRPLSGGLLYGEVALPPSAEPAQPLCSQAG